MTLLRRSLNTKPRHFHMAKVEGSWSNSSIDSGPLIQRLRLGVMDVATAMVRIAVIIQDSTGSTPLILTENGQYPELDAQGTIRHHDVRLSRRKFRVLGNGSPTLRASKRPHRGRVEFLEGEMLPSAAILMQGPGSTTSEIFYSSER